MNRDVKTKSHAMYFETHATQKIKKIHRENFDIFQVYSGFWIDKEITICYCWQIITIAEQWRFNTDLV